MSFVNRSQRKFNKSLIHRNKFYFLGLFQGQKIKLLTTGPYIIYSILLQVRELQLRSLKYAGINGPKFFSKLGGFLLAN